MSISDGVNMQIDKRKIQKLIDDGVITAEELASAEVIDETDEADEN